MKHTITLIPGDGIGPEVAKPTLEIIKAAGVEIDWETFVAKLFTRDLGGSCTTTEFAQAIVRESER